ncbi:MAG TPA: hypothetical protein VNR64_01375, partial [Vicinamibacterales bacterium]|nr:hypothetical protein [Vicinamibacterales bacterium]
DYTRVLLDAPWKTFTGRYTRVGDVRELLTVTDDMYVISKPGDELSLSFDATRLKPLPEGFTRTFLLYADGFSKEMDLHSASPDTVAPLPFHGMAEYPYSAAERRPASPGYQRYVEVFNVRRILRALPPLDRATHFRGDR